MIHWRHQPLAGSSPKEWTERMFGQCAMPFDMPDGETWSCCLPTVDEKSYCLAHCRLLLTPLPKRVR